MAYNKSSAKGAGFERDVARRLSLWWTDGEDAFVFARRSGSGGAPRDKGGASSAAGDIFADKPEGKILMEHYAFELKFYQDLRTDLWRHLAGEDSKFSRFEAQASEAAAPYDRRWVMVAKCNRMPELVFTDCAMLLGGSAGVLPRSVVRFAPLSHLLARPSQAVRHGIAAHVRR